MLEISLNPSEKGLLQKDISINQNISLKYLDHIIYALKRAGLITSLKGKKSGYILTKKPSAIKMLDIYKAFEPDVCIVDCLSGHIPCERENICAVKGFWMILNNKITEYLNSTSLEDLINEQIKINNK